MQKERIGIFGGTFDPVHIGHLILATEMLKSLALDRLLFVPAGDPPHKPGVPLTPAVHRLAMLQLAISRNASFLVDHVDMERAGPSFTSDTLLILSRRFPVDDLVFLMGEDSLRDLPTWKNPQRIVELAEIGVGARPGVRVDVGAICAVIPSAYGRITVTGIPLIEVASRDLRMRVREGRPITYQVTEAVERYIMEHNLYRVPSRQMEG